MTGKARGWILTNVIYREKRRIVTTVVSPSEGISPPRATYPHPVAPLIDLPAKTKNSNVSVFHSPVSLLYFRFHCYICTFTST
jgi:hypothetical protein